ncbi:MAG: metallophosphoesterase [Betaproteobacteria bacterium]|nr:metallophosphoesterase [Betaproteobacteria bacterium]
MPTREEYEAAYQSIGSIRGVAAKFNVHRSTVQEALKHIRHAAREASFSEGAKAAVENAGLNFIEAKGGWIHNYDDEGKKIGTTRWSAPDEETQGLLDRIREAFDGINAAEPIAAPMLSDDDLLTAYIVADLHVGMRAWALETGEAYDTDIATHRLRDWVGRCVASSPSSRQAIILVAGDLLHADDQNNMTPKSKHVLDVDTRHFRTLEVVIEALCASVYLALHKHQRVTVRIIPGNHDGTSYMAVLFALHEHFRNEPRVRVQKTPGEFFVHEFGANMLASHHGDKAKPERIVHELADRYAAIWGRTRHRFLWTGHLHSLKAQDIGGVQWEQVRAMTARDAYAVSHAYASRAQLQAITLHRARGEVQRVKVGA